MISKIITLLLSSILLISCSGLSEEEKLNKVGNKIFEEIKCPKANPWFGSIKVCAKSVSIDEFIEFDLLPTDDGNANMPFSEFIETDQLDYMLRDIVCRGISGSLGISDKAVYSQEHGIAQRAIESEFSNLSEEKFQTINYSISRNIKFVLELSHKDTRYTITRYAHRELNTVPRICYIETRKGV